VPAHGAVSVWQCALRIDIHNVGHDIYSLTYRGGGNEPDNPRIFIVYFSQNL
jgi:hypothetical protein